MKKLMAALLSLILATSSVSAAVFGNQSYTTRADDYSEGSVFMECTGNSTWGGEFVLSQDGIVTSASVRAALMGTPLGGTLPATLSARIGIYQSGVVPSDITRIALSNETEISVHETSVGTYSEIYAACDVNTFTFPSTVALSAGTYVIIVFTETGYIPDERYTSLMIPTYAASSNNYFVTYYGPPQQPTYESIATSYTGDGQGAGMIATDFTLPIWVTYTFAPQTVGYTTIGSDDSFYQAEELSGYSRITAPSDGTITKLTLRCKSDYGTAYVKGLIRSGSATVPQTLLGVTPAVSFNTTRAWRDFTFETGIAITEGSYYWIGTITGVNDILTAEQTVAGMTCVFTYDDNYATPLTDFPVEYTIRADNPISIYATYTPSEGGGEPIIIEIPVDETMGTIYENVY